MTPMTITNARELVDELKRQGVKFNLNATGGIRAINRSTLRTANGVRASRACPLAALSGEPNFRIHAHAKKLGMDLEVARTIAGSADGDFGVDLDVRSILLELCEP